MHRKVDLGDLNQLIRNGPEKSGRAGGKGPAWFSRHLSMPLAKAQHSQQRSAHLLSAVIEGVERNRSGSKVHPSVQCGITYPPDFISPSTLCHFLTREYN